MIPWHDEARQVAYGFAIGDWKGLAIRYNQLLGNDRQRERRIAETQFTLIPSGPYAPVAKNAIAMMHWMNSLEPSVWLEKLFIDAYANVLCNEFNMLQQQTQQEFALSSVNQVLYLRLESSLDQPILLNPEQVTNINNYQFIIMVLHAGEQGAENHFVLLIINRVNRKMFIVDSFAFGFGEDHLKCASCVSHMEKVGHVRNALDLMLKNYKLEKVFVDLSKKGGESSSSSSSSSSNAATTISSGGMFSGTQMVVTVSSPSSSSSSSALGKGDEEEKDGSNGGTIYSGGGRGGAAADDGLSTEIVNNFRLFCVTNISKQEDCVNCGGFVLVYLREILGMLRRKSHKVATPSKPMIGSCRSIYKILREDNAGIQQVYEMRIRIRAEFQSRLLEVFDRVMQINDPQQVQSDISIMYPRDLFVDAIGVDDETVIIS